MKQRPIKSRVIRLESCRKSRFDKIREETIAKILESAKKLKF